MKWVYISQRSKLGDMCFNSRVPEIVAHLQDIIGPARHLKPVKITIITTLCHAEKSAKYISDYTGIHIRSVQRWTARFRESIDGNAETQRKQTGRPRKDVHATLRLLKRELENNPSISAHQIKDNNPI